MAIFSEYVPLWSRSDNALGCVVASSSFFSFTPSPDVVVVVYFLSFTLFYIIRYMHTNIYTSSSKKCCKFSQNVDTLIRMCDSERINWLLLHTAQAHTVILIVDGAELSSHCVADTTRINEYATRLPQDAAQSTVFLLVVYYFFFFFCFLSNYIEKDSTLAEWSYFSYICLFLFLIPLLNGVRFDFCCSPNHSVGAVLFINYNILIHVHRFRCYYYIIIDLICEQKIFFFSSFSSIRQSALSISF